MGSVFFGEFVVVAVSSIRSICCRRNEVGDFYLRVYFLDGNFEDYRRESEESLNRKFTEIVSKMNFKRG